jgi:hypothetical protein
MAKKNIKDYICRPFCSFYREGAKEEFICRGAHDVEMFLERGMFQVAELVGLRRDKTSRASGNCVLDAVVCRRCAFLKEDCDFQSEQRPPDAEPCGGYILLGILAEKGIISLDELSGSDDE